ESGESLREGLGVWHLPSINLVPERDSLVAGAEQSHPDLPEIVTLLLVVAPSGKLGLFVGRGDEGEEVRSVVEEGLERDPEALHHAADDLPLDGSDAVDGKLLHLVPEMLAREAVDVDLEEL